MKKILKSKLNMQKLSNVRSNLPIVASKIQNYSKVLVPKLRILLEKIIVIARKLPWRKIGYFSLAVFVSVFLSMRFYFASPSKIQKQLQSSSDLLTDLDNEIYNTDIVVKSLDDKSLTKLSPKLEEIQKLVGENTNELPSKFLYDIAFSGQDDEFKTQSKNLYNPENIASFDSVSSSAEALNSTVKITDELLNNRKIDKNPEDYISFLKTSIKSLQEVDSEPSVDLTTLIRIITYINESASDYQQNNDIERYQARYDNLSSELVKEIKLAWSTSVGGKLRQKVSAQNSTQQALINKLD